MSTYRFFEEPKEHSKVKANIVSKYFDAWSKIMAKQARKRGGKIAYIDLFAGPGYYEDGTESTPLLILRKATQDRDLRNMLITIFNDNNEEYIQLLEKSISNIPGFETLIYKPYFF